MGRITYQNDTFRCHIDCERCNAIKADNKRCKNRVCFGVPTCWIHNKQKYNIKTKPTAHGRGLFTTEDIPAKTWICPYVGENISFRCLERRYGDTTATYATDIDNNRFIDAACRRGIASLANGRFAANGKSLPRSMHNAEIVMRSGRTRRNDVWLKSLKKIPANKEIFVWYGSNFRLGDEHSTKRTKLTDNRPC